MGGFRAAVIMNPNSASGRTGRRWSAMEQRLRARCGECAVFSTCAPGHATALTRAALEKGYDRIVSVGGDGTHFEVLNGFFQQGALINSEAVFAILPFGTGSDLARSLGIPRSAKALDVVCGENEILLADVGRIVLTNAAGEPETVYFLNTCHIGVGGEVAVQVNARAKQLGGFAAFLWGTLKALCIYRNKRMSIVLDDLVLDQMVKELIIAKGQYDGGGMHVAPQARFDNGLFEVFLVGEVSLLDAVRSLPLLYHGQLHRRPDIVQQFQARHLRVECTESVPVSPHGELPGFLPATFDLLPRILRVAQGSASA